MNYLSFSMRCQLFVNCFNVPREGRTLKILENIYYIYIGMQYRFLNPYLNIECINCR